MTAYLDCWCFFGPSICLEWGPKTKWSHLIGGAVTNLGEVPASICDITNGHCSVLRVFSHTVKVKAEPFMEGDCCSESQAFNGPTWAWRLNSNSRTLNLCSIIFLCTALLIHRVPERRKLSPEVLYMCYLARPPADFLCERALNLCVIASHSKRFATSAGIYMINRLHVLFSTTRIWFDGFIVGMQVID